jgi:hypothetical protein
MTMRAEDCSARTCSGGKMPGKGPALRREAQRAGLRGEGGEGGTLAGCFGASEEEALRRIGSWETAHPAGLAEVGGKRRETTRRT